MVEEYVLVPSTWWLSLAIARLRLILCMRLLYESGKKGMKGIVTGVSVGAVVLIAPRMLMGLIWCRIRKSDCFQNSLVAHIGRDDEDEGMEIVVQGKMGIIPIFSYEVLKQARNYFDEKNQIGDGGLVRYIYANSLMVMLW